MNFAKWFPEGLWFQCEIKLFNFLQLNQKNFFSMVGRGLNSIRAGCG